MSCCGKRKKNTKKLQFFCIFQGFFNFVTFSGVHEKHGFYKGKLTIP